MLACDEALEFHRRPADDLKRQRHGENHIRNTERKRHTVQLAGIEKCHAREDEVTDDDVGDVHLVAGLHAVEENHAPECV